MGIGTTTPQYKLDVNGDINIANNNVLRFGGNQYLYASSTPDGSVILGINAGQNLIDAYDYGWGNTFIGNEAGKNMITGSGNIFLGKNSGYSGINANGNIFIGNSSGYYTEGGSNIFIGPYAGVNNINGTYNTFIGYTAGQNNTGSSNIFIGPWAGMNETGSNKLIITNNIIPSTSSLIYGEFDNNILSFNAKVGIGTSTPATELEVHGAATSTVSVISEGGSNKGGRIILEDSDGAGCSEIYILDGVISSASVACPTN